LNQLLRQTPLSPLSVTLTSYNRQIVAVQDLERLFMFTTEGGNGVFTRRQAGAIVQGFEKAFFGYLNGTGHVAGTSPVYVTAEEFNLRASDPLIRANLVLRQLTDSWLLPLGDHPTVKIKVQCTLSAARHVHKPHL
jgi:hypothetical protein